MPANERTLKAKARYLRQLEHELDAMADVDD
jgi:hypothetical protein